MHNDQLLNYQVKGSGYPLVFLHGFLESISMWDYLELNSLNFQIILVDLPGHGSSSLDDDEMPSIEFMAFKVAELLSALNITCFSVIGHSMGGYVGLKLKHLYSQKYDTLALKCDKVVLLNSNFWEDSAEKKRDRLRVAEIVSKNKELFLNVAIPNLFNDKFSFKKEIDLLTKEAMNMDAYAIVYASLAMRNRNDYSFLLSNFLNDFLILQGVLDPVSSMNQMVKSLEGFKVELRLMENVGHMAHIEDPTSLIEIIDNYFHKSNLHS